MLKTKISRVTFILTILGTFMILHFGLEEPIQLSGLIKDFISNPIAIPVYFALLLVPATALSFVGPWLVNWVKEGK